MPRPKPTKRRTNFYPRPPRGGRLQFSVMDIYSERFLSTPSARRATKFNGMDGEALVISIHALREEGDCHSLLLVLAAINFYPRPPRGGRR